MKGLPTSHSTSGASDQERRSRQLREHPDYGMVLTDEFSESEYAPNRIESPCLGIWDLFAVPCPLSWLAGDGQTVRLVEPDPIIKRIHEALAAPPRITRTGRKNPAPPEREIPLMFVDVDPDVATTEPPEKTPYYSSVSSKAANPEVSVDSEVPKIDGNQTHIVKTFDTPRPNPTPVTPPPQTAQPLQPQAQDTPAPQVAAEQPKGGESLGDLAMAKPRPKPTPGEGRGGR